MFGLSFAVWMCIYAHAHTRKSKKCWKGDILCMYCAIEYQKIRFEPLFRLVERIKLKNGIVIGRHQNKRSIGLKNRLFGFCVNFRL